MKMSPNSEINEGCKRLAERLLGGKSGSNSENSSASGDSRTPAGDNKHRNDDSRTPAGDDKHRNDNSRTPADDGKHHNGDAYNYKGMDMVFVEGTEGAFGTPGFYIGKYEVTQAQWQKVMGKNPSNFKGNNLPVENVSWKDIQEFLQKLNAMTGGNFRLPSEAEWMDAANGGLNKDNYEYAGSNTIDDVAWFKDNSGKTTHPVGTKQPNSIGIYDMSGNVWEWCQDYYINHSNRVNRGGSWGNGAGYCRVANRNGRSPGSRDSYSGFRLAYSSE
jgi:hypothetical protein